MNEENMKFLRKNGIDIYEINEKVNCYIYSREEENPIVANYAFYKPVRKGEMSISSIIGYDTYQMGYIDIH